MNIENMEIWKSAKSQNLGGRKCVNCHQMNRQPSGPLVFPHCLVLLMAALMQSKLRPAVKGKMNSTFHPAFCFWVELETANAFVWKRVTLVSATRLCTGWTAPVFQCCLMHPFARSGSTASFDSIPTFALNSSDCC